MVKLDDESKDNFKYLQKKIKKPYRGYIKEGERYESDMAFKKYIESKLSQLSDDLKMIQEAALMSQMITTWTDLDRLISSFEELIFVVKNTTYGMSTFFESKVIKDFNLNYLSKLERVMTEILVHLSDKIQSFNEAIESGMLSDSSRITNEILNDLAAVREAWEERKKIITDFQKLGLI